MADPRSKAAEERRHRLRKRDFKCVVRVVPPPSAESPTDLPTIGIENKHILSIVDRKATEPQIHRFIFDAVFGPLTSNAAFYEAAVRSLTGYALRGYNAALLLYGASATKKRATLVGSTPDSDDGVVYRAIQQMISHLPDFALPVDDSLTVSSSACAVFMSVALFIGDQVIDGLSPANAQSLEVLDGDMVSIPGLSQHEIRSPEDIQPLLLFAQQGLGIALNKRKRDGQLPATHIVYSLAVERTDKRGVRECVSGRMMLIQIAPANQSSNEDVAHLIKERKKVCMHAIESPRVVRPCVFWPQAFDHRGLSSLAPAVSDFSLSIPLAVAVVLQRSQRLAR